MPGGHEFSQCHVTLAPRAVASRGTRDLLAWIKQAGLVPDDAWNGFRKSAVPGELDAIAAQARALRDWFQIFCLQTHARAPIARSTRSTQPTSGARSRVRSDRGSGSAQSEENRGFQPGVASSASLAFTRVAAPSLGAITGLPRLHGRLHLRESLRRAALHASVRRSNPRPCAKMVQHNDLRKSSKAVRAPMACSASTKTLKLDKSSAARKVLITSSIASWHCTVPLFVPGGRSFVL